MNLGIFFSVVEQIHSCFVGHMRGMKKPGASARKRNCRLIQIPKVSPKIKGVFSAKPPMAPVVKKNPLRRLIKRDLIEQLGAPFEVDRRKNEADFLTLSARMASSQPLHAHLVVSKCLEQASQATTPPNCSSHQMLPLIKEKKEDSSVWISPREEERQFQITRPKL